MVYRNPKKASQTIGYPAINKAYVKWTGRVCVCDGRTHKPLFFLNLFVLVLLHGVRRFVGSKDS